MQPAFAKPILLFLVALVTFAGCSSRIRAVKDFGFSDGGWNMFRRNLAGVVDDSTRTVASRKLLWSRKFGGRFYASPIINDGLGVIPALNKMIYYFDPMDGDGRGHIKMKSSSSSTAALFDNLLYVASEHGDERLMCVNINKGEAVWQMKLGDISAPIIINRKSLFVGDYAGNFYCVNRFTGDINWQIETGSPITGCAAVYGEKVYVGSTSGTLYCLDLASGETIWKFETGGAIFGGPAIDVRCYFGSADGNLYCVDLDTGQLLWRFPTDGQIFSSPVSDGNSVYFGSNDNRVYRVSQYGRPMWNFDTGGVVTGSPLVLPDEVVIGAANGSIFWLDRETGNLENEFETDRGAVTSAISYGGKIYVACSENMLYCFGLK